MAVTHEYCNAKASAPSSHEIRNIAAKLVEMKKKGYPLVNSVGYLKAIAKEKNWTCKPWVSVNIGPEGKLVLPCYVRMNMRLSFLFLKHDVKTAISEFDWKETQNCKECSLHCYVEPSLVLSGDFRTFVNWAVQVSPRLRA